MEVYFLVDFEWVLIIKSFLSGWNISGGFNSEGPFTNWGLKVGGFFKGGFSLCDSLLLLLLLRTILPACTIALLSITYRSEPSGIQLS